MKLTEVLGLNRLKKTLLYRVTSMVLGQFLALIFFGSMGFPIAVGLGFAMFIDLGQTVWYYTFEWGVDKLEERKCLKN